VGLSSVSDIPRIMRANGWHKGARLLDRWFSLSSNVAPRYADPDTATIRMDSFILTFPRARAVYDQLLGARIWANPAAQMQIEDWLRRSGRLAGGTRRFGDFTQPFPGLDRVHINFRTVGFGVTDSDDLAAALGNFAFHVIIKGDVSTSVSGRYLVTIDEVGIYARDSFDFNGDQFLGYWDSSDDSVSMLNGLSGDRVDNERFRDYRRRHGRGGDFLVFSDIKTVRLSPPDTFGFF
jgi:hypothetical protein